MNNDLILLKNAFIVELKSNFGFEPSDEILIESAEDITELKALRKKLISKQVEILREATKELFKVGKITNKSLIIRVELTKQYAKMWELYEIAYRIANKIPNPKTQRKNARKKALESGTPIVSVIHSSVDSESKSIKPIYTPMGGQRKS